MASESRYVYFISYVFRANTTDVFANTVAELIRPITAFGDIVAVQTSLRADGYPNALVLGFHQMRE